MSKSATALKLLFQNPKRIPEVLKEKGVACAKPPLRIAKSWYIRVVKILTSSLRVANYQRKYKSLKNPRGKVALLTTAIGTPHTLASSNYFGNWVIGFRDSQYDALAVPVFQGTPTDILDGELLYGFSPKHYRSYDKFLIQKQFDCIICHNTPFLFDELKSLKKRLDAQYFLSAGESMTRLFSDEESIKKHIEQANNLIDGIVVVSEYLRDEWRKDGFLGQILVTRVPVNMDSQPDYIGSANANRAAYFGNLQHKEIENILEIALLVRKHIPNFTVEIYGDGMPEDLERVAKMIDVKSVSSIVFLKPAVSFKNMRIIQSEVDVLLLPREKAVFSDAGFPNKLGEYLASGCPVVCTKIGEVESVITNREHAFLVEANNNELFAEAVVECLNNREASIAMGLRARNFISRYASPKDIAAKFLKWVDGIH